MIINDAHEIVFIHIPKCAGSTIRRRLENLDDTAGRFARPDGYHPDLGPIDMGHLPLAVIHDHFKVEFDKVNAYSAYALVRNPFARFPSSLAQHLKMYGSRPIQRMSPAEVSFQIGNVIDFLENYSDPLLPHQYIHFQRQSDYVFFGDERIVEHVYTIDDISAMVADISRRLGSSSKFAGAAAASDDLAARSVVYRNEGVRILLEHVRPLAGRMLPRLVYRTLNAMVAGRLYAPRQERLAHLFESSRVRDFVAEYYRSDVRLVDSITTD